MTQHDLGCLKIRDHAVFHPAERHDVLRGSAEHLLGVVSDGKSLMRRLADSDHGGLGKHDAPVFQIDQTVGSPKVDSNIA